MKIKDLVNYWDKHARGRLTRDAYFADPSDQHHKRLEKLAALYPMKSSQDLMRDLISAALDELETSFPYVQGSKVVAFDEDGFEIYEDQGMTPRFISLSQKHIQRLKADLSDTADIQYRARQLTEDMAVALQAKLLLEAGNSVVSDAFIASRLEGRGRVYGTLPRGVDVEALLARSTPHLV